MTRTPLKRYTPLARPTSPLRRSKLRPVSAKRKAQRPARDECRAAVYERAGGLCEGHTPWCTGAGEQVHEPLTRARLGSITDEGNAKLVCAGCQRWIHLHDGEATKLGLLVPGWVGDRIRELERELMYRSIEAGLWTDPKVRKLEPTAKLLFLYLITNPHSHLCGLYYLPRALIEHETGLSGEPLERGIDTLSKGYLALFDSENDLVWVVNMFRYQAHGRNATASAKEQVTSLHKSSLVSRFCDHYADLGIPLPYPIDTPSKGERLKEQEQEQEQEKEQSNASAVAAASPAEPADPKPASKPRRSRTTAPAADTAAPGKPATRTGAHAELIAHFTAGWAGHFGAKYAFQHAKDGAAVGRILKALDGDLERAKRLVSAYLADPDPFVTKTGHTLAVLASQLNRYLARADGAGDTAPEHGRDDNGFVRKVTPEMLAAIGGGRSE